jgi:hypothetical protein
MPKLFDRVKVNIATVGNGTVTFGPASSPAFLTPAEAGAVDGNTVRYVFVDGTDFEEGVGTILASVAQMSRDIVTRSKIAGSLGSTKINLSGTAVLVFTASAADILNPANNLSDLGSAPAARSNLGLGSAATAATSAFLQPGNNLSDLGSASTARSNLGGTTVGKAIYIASDAAAARDAALALEKTSTNAALVAEQAAPTTPASGKFAIYAGADGRLETKNDDGAVRRYAEIISRTVIVNGNTSADIVLPSGYSSFKIMCERVRMNSDATFLAVRGSFDGVNFANGASDYLNAYFSNSNGVLSAASTSASSCFLSGSVDNTASTSYSVTGEVTITQGVAAETMPIITAAMGYLFDTSQNMGQINMHSALVSAYGPLQAVRIFANVGTLSRGAFVLIGFKG